jgi:hypothetical protein
MQIGDLCGIKVKLNLLNVKDSKPSNTYEGLLIHLNPVRTLLSTSQKNHKFRNQCNIFFVGTANLAYMLLNFRITNSIEFNAIALNTVINTDLTGQTAAFLFLIHNICGSNPDTHTSYWNLSVVFLSYLTHVILWHVRSRPK